jgi:Protein of unknown function (DUF3341)
MPEPLVALFDDPDRAERALALLQGQGVIGAQVASPAPYPVVNQTGHPGPWRALGWVATIGGLTGLACAAALQVFTSQHLGLVVGGKPIVAWPAFGVVMFELTMLFAGAANFTALVIFSALARRRVARSARDLVGTDRIVVVVPEGAVPPGRREALRSALAALAVEVRA